MTSTSSNSGVSSTDELDCTREPFNSRLFVGHKQTLKTLRDWATQATPPRNRLRSVIAPPGYGKTWLLSQLEETFSAETDLFIASAAAKDMPDEDAIADWLKSTRNTLAVQRPAARLQSPNGAPENIITDIHKLLTHPKYPELRLLVIVDGMDEISPATQRFVQKRLFDQFWASKETRFIVSARSEFRLISHLLRRGEKRMSLPLFDEQDWQAQLEKRADVLNEQLPVSKEKLATLLAPYKLNVPCLNFILFRKIEANHKAAQTPPLSADDLRESWISLLRRPAELSRELETDLKCLAKLPDDGWNIEMFARQCSYSERDALARIDKLSHTSVVTTNPPGQRYKIVDGLRELLRAEHRMREEEE